MFSKWGENQDFWFEVPVVGPVSRERTLGDITRFSVGNSWMLDEGEMVLDACLSLGERFLQQS